MRAVAVNQNAFIGRRRRARSDAPCLEPSELAQLTTLTGYTGPATNALAWLGENLAGFRFDPAQQRYVLEPKH